MIERTILAKYSAKVFPRHILFPPKNGPKLIGCLLAPLGVLDFSELESNLSGINSSGLYHCEGLWCSK
jgi:hypothetical protein